ncbi:hypothetical protein GQX73_g6194 [Xylaria multiplex]|uniref:Uncharacterized protein n=1 Tax=Xylaria multiplex TaxID=323545 RepID=A0A7C8IVF1_9PEZI|nr:hypothetical protein GQX73_g6194 [Xylaria multiplex]
MPEYDYYEFSLSGSPRRYTRSQSFSYHNQPRSTRLRCPENCAAISVDTYNDLYGRERKAVSHNESLLRENRTLKNDYRVVYQQNQDLRGELNDLKGRYSRDDNILPKLRRRITSLKEDLDIKELTLRDLRLEKDRADIRIRTLTGTVRRQNDEISGLGDDLACLRRTHKKDQHDLGVRDEEVKRLRRRLGCREPFYFSRYGSIF